MAGYSKTPLVQRLGLKNAMMFCAKNPPDEYKDLISPLPEGTT